jgi:hypothetical protein
MAFTRQVWVEKVRQSLVGALGQYTKQKYADMVGYNFDWSEEIEALLYQARTLCSEKTKTKEILIARRLLLKLILK